jgi:hypothetical protein
MPHMEETSLRSLRPALLLVATLSLLMIANTAGAQIWVAATGMPDEDSQSTILFDNGSAFLRPSLTTGSATLRFNVLPVGVLVTPLTSPSTQSRALAVRYLDNGSGAQVIVKLKRLNVNTGGVLTLLTFNSNDHPQGSTFQQPTPTIGEGSFFNFSFAQDTVEGVDTGVNYAYFIEAKLIRTAAGGTPGLATIRIITAFAP